MMICLKSKQKQLTPTSHLFTSSASTWEELEKVATKERNRIRPLLHRVSKHFRIEKDLLLASLAHLLLPLSDLNPKSKLLAL